MKNIAASVRARLMNQAKTSGQPFAALLERFVIGRLLWRVSHCDGANQFVLKGAQLFFLWAPELHRPNHGIGVRLADWKLTLGTQRSPVSRLARTSSPLRGW